MALLTVTQLQIETEQRKILVEPISFRLQQGENLTILGETGSGKSLLVQGIMGALPQGLQTRGEINVENCKITAPSHPLQTLWGRTLVMLPQEPRRSLNPIMRIGQQLWESFHFVAGIPRKQAEQQVTQRLTHLGLSGSEQTYPHQLSGGMAQRCAFAIATSAGGKILLADEPTKGLDPQNKQKVIELLKQAYQKEGALLTITHDIDVATALGGTIFVMKKGQLLEKGQAEQILNTPTHPYTQSLINASPKRWQCLPKKGHSAPLVRVENFSLQRGHRILFKQLSFTLHHGEVLGIIGKSGIGKSSLADALCGLLKPTTGSIQWAEKHKPHQRLKLYQDPPEAFAPNVPLQRLLDDVIQRHQLDRTPIASLLTQLNLSPDILHRTAENVSGGELQRIAILRALLLNPVLLFADEVTSRLDPITQQETITLLVEQCRARGYGLILVSHDHELIQKCCDQVIDLEQYC